MNAKRRSFVLLALAMLTLVGIAAAADVRSELGAARHGTAPFKNVAVAEAAGYAVFPDAQGITCIDNPGVGAMGIHYVNGAFVGDTVLDPARPESVVYEPGPHGALHLVAVEYIVFQEAWDAVHHGPPTLFGQEFELTSSDNRYGIPAFYSLHAWIWKGNPSGLFAEWNPRVTCR